MTRTLARSGLVTYAGARFVGGFSVIRRFCMLIAMCVAIVGAFAAPPAEAQGDPTCDVVLVTEPEPSPDTAETTDTAETGDQPYVERVGRDCADAVAYPGPFTVRPDIPSSPFVAPANIIAAPQPVPETAVVDDPPPLSSRDLAHSGTETFVLAYLGTGLLAFGAFAMGIRRGTRLPD